MSIIIYRFSGPNPYRSSEPKINDNVAKVKNEIKSVVNVMQNNISKVLDRGAKLDDLHDKSGKNFYLI